MAPGSCGVITRVVWAAGPRHPGDGEGGANVSVLIPSTRYLQNDSGFSPQPDGWDGESHRSKVEVTGSCKPDS